MLGSFSPSSALPHPPTSWEARSKECLVDEFRQLQVQPAALSRIACARSQQAFGLAGAFESHQSVKLADRLSPWSSSFCCSCMKPAGLSESADVQRNSSPRPTGKSHPSCCSAKTGEHHKREPLLSFRCPQARIMSISSPAFAFSAPTRAHHQHQLPKPFSRPCPVAAQPRQESITASAPQPFHSSISC